MNNILFSLKKEKDMTEKLKEIGKTLEKLQESQFGPVKSM